ncbi:MAG: arsR [Thermoleophilia bacterium]|nr:arsR [Thermoleophilia bacterium]
MADTATNARHAYDRTIQADVEDVWRAITDPDEALQFHFDSIVDSSWMPGEPVRYLDEDGEVVVDGVIVDIDAPHRLVHTFAFADGSPAKASGDAPSQVTWTLEPEDEGTRLTLVHDGFSSQNATWRTVEDGWEDILDSLVVRFDNDLDEDS